MNKKFSKSLFFIVILVCAYIMTACSSNLKNRNNTNDNKGQNKIDNQIPDDKKEGKVNLKDKDSYYFIVNGKKYTTDNTLKEIEESGLVQDSSAAQTDMQKGSYSVSNGVFKDSENGNTIFSVIPINNTDEVVKASEATIGGMSLEEYYYKNYNGKIEIIGGITIGSTLNELIDMFGEPTEKDDRENYENLGMLYKYRVRNVSVF